MSIDAIRGNRYERADRPAEKDVPLRARTPPQPVSIEAARRHDRLIESIGTRSEYPAEMFGPPRAQTPAPKALEAERREVDRTPTGPIYTASENEVETRNTPVVPRALVAAVRRQWPGLTEQGARTLVAQSSFETGHWANCYNFNLGNAKRFDASRPHMYLQGTWEGVTRRYVAEEGRLETDEEVLTRYRKEHPKDADLVRLDNNTDHAKAVGPDKVSLRFSAPHEMARFVAHASLDDGVAAWTKKLQSFPGMTTALNSGDAAQVAHILRRHGYYTGGEAEYAAGIASHQQALRNEL